MTLGERGVGRRRRRRLLDRCAFARQRRFIGGQRVSGAQSRVSRGDVASLEHEDIARHDRVGRHHDAVAVAHDPCAWRGHRAQRHAPRAPPGVPGGTRSTRIEHHNRADRDRIEPFAEGRGQQRWRRAAAR